jgi:hypothetical protein
MAAVTAGITTPSISTPFPGKEHQITGLLAGEALGACVPCFIHSDGTVMKADGSAADAEAVVAGWTATPASAGEPVTLFFGVFFAYHPKVGGSDMAPNLPLYLSTTEGTLDSAATTGGTLPIAYTVGDGRIFVVNNWTK